MGLKSLIRNFPKIMRQPEGFRPALARALAGQPAQNVNEAALQDSIDLIPVVGDVPNIIKVLSNKGNRIRQLEDTLIGAIPIIGDVADLLLASDTNIQQVERIPEWKQRKGRLETLVTLSFVPNAIERYIGGVDRSIWED